MVAAITIEPGDSAQNPARTPLVRPPLCVNSSVNTRYSFVTGWPRFFRALHYPGKLRVEALAKAAAAPSVDRRALIPHHLL